MEGVSGNREVDAAMQKEKVKKESAAAAETEEDDEPVDATEEDRRMRGGKKGAAGRCCQAERCAADLTEAKQYHRRHKVCEHHAKAQVAIVAGIRQRFCQQCSRFHELSEFDEAKRSCRRRLAGHNERRRKSSVDTNTESGSGGGGRGKGTDNGQLKELVCGQADERGRIQLAIQDNASSYKHFQIR